MAGDQIQQVGTVAVSVGGAAVAIAGGSAAAVSAATLIVATGGAAAVVLIGVGLYKYWGSLNEGERR